MSKIMLMWVLSVPKFLNDLTISASNFARHPLSRRHCTRPYAGQSIVDEGTAVAVNGNPVTTTHLTVLHLLVTARCVTELIPITLSCRSISAGTLIVVISVLKPA